MGRKTHGMKVLRLGLNTLANTEVFHLILNSKVIWHLGVLVLLSQMRTYF